MEAIGASVPRSGRVGRGRGSVQLGVAQILVDGLPADPVFTGEDIHWNTAARALDEFGRPFRGEGLFPPLVGAALLAKAMPSFWQPLMRERSNSAKAIRKPNETQPRNTFVVRGALVQSNSWKPS